MAKQAVVERGQKTEHIRAAFDKFGLDCTMNQARLYIKQQFGYDVSDTTFYNERKRLKTAAAQSPTPSAAPVHAKTEKPVDMGGILELVDAGQRLVKSLGKDRAKELIDKL